MDLVNVHLPVHVRLKRAREALGLSRPAMAALVHYRAPTIAAIEQGRRGAKDEYVLAVIELLRAKRRVDLARGLAAARCGPCRFRAVYGAAPEWRRAS